MRLFFCLFGLLFSITLSAQNRLLTRTINPVDPLFSENPGQGFFASSAGLNFTQGLYYSAQLNQTIYKSLFGSINFARERVIEPLSGFEDPLIKRSLWSYDLSLGYQLPKLGKSSWQQALMIGYRNSIINQEGSYATRNSRDFHRARSREYRLAYHLASDPTKKTGFITSLAASFVQVYSVETPVNRDPLTAIDPSILTGAAEGDQLLVLEPMVGFRGRFNRWLSLNVKVNAAIGLNTNPNILGNNLLVSASLQYHWLRD